MPDTLYKNNGPVFPPLATENKGWFYGYLVVLAAFLMMMMMHVVLYSFSVFFKPVSAEFGWSRAETSLGYSMILLVSGALMIVTGRLTDRLGPWKVLLVCSLCFGAGYILMSTMTSLWQFYLFCGLVAAGYAGGYGPLLTTIARWFERKRGLMSGVMLSGVGLGTAIGPLVTNFLISGYGWRLAYIYLGVTSLVVLLLLTQFLKREPGRPIRSTKTADENEEAKLKSRTVLSGYTLKQSTETWQFWMIWVILVLVNLALHAVMLHIVPYATDLGITSTVAASILTVVGLANMIGRVGAGVITDFIGNKQMLITGMVMEIISVVWLLFCSTPMMFYFIGAIYGMGFACLAVFLSPLMAEYFGLKALGVSLGIMVLGANLGGAIGPYVAGCLFDGFGSYSMAFIILTALCLVGLVLTFSLRPPARFQVIKEE